MKKRNFVKFGLKLLTVLMVALICVGCNQKVLEEVTQEITENNEVHLLNGVSIEEYAIIYSEETNDYDYRAALYIRNAIADYTGHRLNVRPDSMPAETEHEIVVGDTARSISKKLDADTKNMEFAIMADESSIALEGDYFIIAAAAYFFIETYIPDEYFKSVVPQETLIHEPIQKEAKNYIVMIGDGMGFNQTRLYEYYGEIMSILNDYNDGEDIFYGYYFPNQGESKTNSLTGVTDSAAGGTALATGYKTNNKYVGRDKMGLDIQSLTELAGSLGKATAVLSTDSVTGATPASFSAHALDRNDSSTIRSSQEELKQKYGTLINCGKNPYDTIGVKALEGEINNALNILSRDSDGFFMMYEEAHIDKHCHNNDLQSTFNAVVRFNQAIGIVMEYAFYNPDTFVLITADHETGGINIKSDGTFKYTSTDHTGANVPVFAYGMNADVFNGKIIENTQIPKTIAQMMGVANFGDDDGFESLLK